MAEKRRYPTANERAQTALFREQAKQAEAETRLAENRITYYEKRMQESKEREEKNKSLIPIKVASEITSGLSRITNSWIKDIKPIKSDMNGGLTSFYSPQRVFILRRTNRTVKPSNFDQVVGRLCLTTYTLSELEGQGFTKVQACHMDGIPATSKELESIYQYLTDGVIL